MIEVEVYFDEELLGEERMAEGEEELVQDAWVEIVQVLMAVVVEGNALTSVVLVRMPISHEVISVVEIVELYHEGLPVFLHTDPKQEYHQKP